MGSDYSGYRITRGGRVIPRAALGMAGGAAGRDRPPCRNGRELEFGEWRE